MDGARYQEPLKMQPCTSWRQKVTYGAIMARCDFFGRFYTTSCQYSMKQKGGFILWGWHMLELIVLFTALSATNIGVVSVFTSDEKARELNEIAVKKEEEKSKNKASLMDAYF